MLRTILVAISFFIIAGTQSTKAQIQLSDSAKISLMTTSPWDGAIYAVYGHTAIMVRDDSLGIDKVFNYGYFDTSRPNFMYHFVRGETDYVVEAVPLEFFLNEYRMKGVEVVEQELNLTQEEKQNLWNALYINTLPENKSYRYNFFYDNCVTRPRDLTEKHVQGVIQYPADTNVQTFRDLVHECVSAFPWMKFGIDLVIGSDADKPITLREKMFLPVYLLNAFEGANVEKPDTVSYPLVKNTEIVVPLVNQSKADGEWGVFNPLSIAFALLFITILISVVQIVKLNRIRFPKIYDTFLFVLFGLGGLVIFFLMFFSVHPATNPNWNFVWMNIFALIFAFLFWVKSAKKAVNIYHFINFAVLTLFLLLWWFIPQQLPPATIPFSMSLWIRSGMNVFMLRKRRMTNKRYVSSKYMKAGWGGDF
ncbi:MAG: DUF4105 domain-containing protein [Bacteroidia bacterium]|nr:DUF4105 domain-containing protein [Bacteroidia bacterium]